MSRHSLETDYATLIRRFPTTALRAFGAALRAERERSHPPRDEVSTKNVIVADGALEFEEDHSHIWAWDIDDGAHYEYAKLYRSTVEWVAGITDDELLLLIPGLILGETRIALAWRAVLEIAAIHASVLGSALWSTVTSPVLLRSLDTRRPANSAIAAIYPFLSEAERRDAETEWLAQDFSEFRNPDRARAEVLGTLFEAVGEARLETSEARTFLRQAKADGQEFKNSRPVAFRMTRGADRHWLEHEGIDVTEPCIAPLLALSGALHAARDAFKEDATTENGKALWDATSELNKAIAEAGSIVSAVDQEVSDSLAEGLGLTLSRGLVPDNVQNAALADLLKLSHHKYPPTPDEEAQQQFAAFPSWGSPSPRIRAAQSIATLATMLEFWPVVHTRFEELLLEDPHPAVRLQLMNVIPWLERVDADAMWALLGRVFERETNGAILQGTVSGCFALRRRHAVRLEPLILPFAAIKLPDRSDDPATGLLVFFALDGNRPASREVLTRWIADFVAEEERLRAAVGDIRGLLLRGINESDPRKDQTRARVRDFLWMLIEAMEPAVRSLPISNQKPTSEELSALKLFNAIAEQVFYAVGHDELTPELATSTAKRRFLEEHTPLISKLTTLGTPRTVHHLLSVLDKMTEVAPEQCFDLFSEAMLRTTGMARYEHESMGAGLFVELVGRYLADYRSIFEDETRRRKLIDCIAVFVEAGWPEARKLFQRLPELLQ